MPVFGYFPYGIDPNKCIMNEVKLCVFHSFRMSALGIIMGSNSLWRIIPIVCPFVFISDHGFVRDLYPVCIPKKRFFIASFVVDWPRKQTQVVAILNVRRYPCNTRALSFQEYFFLALFRGKYVGMFYRNFLKTKKLLQNWFQLIVRRYSCQTTWKIR